MKFHWKVLLWMVAGALLGTAAQLLLPGPTYLGATWETRAGGLELVAAAKNSPAAGLDLGSPPMAVAVILGKGTAEEEKLALRTPEDVAGAVERSGVGEVLWFERADGKLRSSSMGLAPDSLLAKVIAPFDFLATIFMRLLRMLIVPIVFTSIVCGVAGVGDLKDLRRMGGKAFLYYMGTSMLAIVVGQILVTMFTPGEGAPLGLADLAPEAKDPEADFTAFLRTMVPENVFGSLGDNGAMLQIIFAALMVGFFMTRTPEPYKTRTRELFEALFNVILKMAEGIMTLLPYGVFFLLFRVVAKTGFGVFEPLLYYMAIVTAALLLHACVTLPLVLRVAGISPRAWAKAMSPAIMTAFSTSSSSMTLPVTLETVERRGKVSNRITSFTLPLGATINMDGTALYECIGVIFLAQYYQSTGSFELTFGVQVQVVIMALLASVGAAGIPSAGLVMMLTILAALGLPLEGAALLLAVDRPLDMLRTVVNVWSDSCGAAVIARSEGEEGPLHAGSDL